GPPEGGLEVAMHRGRAGGVDAVEGDAGADHVQVSRGVEEDGAAVGGVADGSGLVRGDGVGGGAEGGELLGGRGVVGFFAAGEVGAEGGEPERGEAVDAGD